MSAFQPFYDELGVAKCLYDRPTKIFSNPEDRNEEFNITEALLNILQKYLIARLQITTIMKIIIDIIDTMRSFQPIDCVKNEYEATNFSIDF